MRKIRLITLTLVLAFVGAACEPAPYAGDQAAPKVFFTGDSLTHQSADTIKWLTVADGKQVAGSYWGGTDMAWAAEKLMFQMAGDKPDTVMVLSGTNNWVDGWNAYDDKSLHDALEWAKEARCAVWVTPASHGLKDGRMQPWWGKVAVEKIVKGAAKYPNVHVARWDQHSRNHPEWYVEDGIHHTEEGRWQYGAFAHNARKQHCG